MTFENHNDYIQWRKTSDCHGYTITNLSSTQAVRVTITELTKDDNGMVATPIFVIDSLAPSTTQGWTAPHDGLYELCAAPLVPTIISTTTDDTTRVRRTYVELTGATSTDDLLSVTTSAGPVGIGAPLSTWLPNGGTIPTVNTFLSLNGGGQCFVIPPNVTLVGYPHTPSTSWTFVIDSLANVTITTVAYEVAGSPTSTSNVQSACLFIAQDTPAATVFQHWITAFVINGTNILTRYYDTRYELNLFYNDVTVWLQAHGGGGVYIGATGDPYFYTLTCQDIQSIDFSEVRTIEQLTLCAYIIDLCDMTKCMDKLVREWLCYDPCKETCDATEKAKRTKARDNALWISRMFYMGLQPFISQDTLYYLGSWTQEEQRIVRTTKINNLYSKIHKFLEQCDLCPSPDTCGGCQGC